MIDEERRGERRPLLPRTISREGSGDTVLVRTTLPTSRVSTLPWLLFISISTAISLFIVRWYLPALFPGPFVALRPHSAHEITHIKSQHFVDRFGRQRLFRGVNVVYKAPPYHPDVEHFHANVSFSARDVDILADLGLNSIRLGVMWPGAEPRRGEWNRHYFKVLKQIVERCHQKGIYVLLEFHQDNFGPRFCGEGFPTWLVEPAFPPSSFRGFPFPWDKPWSLADSRYQNCSAREDWAKFQLSWATSRAFQDLYDNKDGALDLFAKFWHRVAFEFKEFDNILGYEIMNEPWVGDIFADPLRLVPGVADGSNLARLHRQVADRIVEADKDAIVFFEHVSFDNLFSGVYETPAAPERSVLAFHYYERALGGPNLFSLPFTISQRKWDAARLKSGLFLSEFDIGYYGGNMTGLVERLEALDKGLISWTGFSYKPFIQITGWGDSLIGMHTGELRKEMAKLFARPFVSAVAGQLRSMTFNRETRRLAVEFAPDGEIKEPTTIVVPEKWWYPEGFKVKVIPEESLKVEVVEERGTGHGRKPTLVKLRAGGLSTVNVVQVEIIPSK